MPSGFAGRLASGVTTELPIVFQTRGCLSCEATFDVYLFTPLNTDEVGADLFKKHMDNMQPGAVKDEDEDDD